MNRYFNTFIFMFMIGSIGHISSKKSSKECVNACSNQYNKCIINSATQLSDMACELQDDSCLDLCKEIKR